MYPIKSKSGSEITEAMRNFVFRNGAPKVVISDKGKEFSNNIVQKLLETIGAEHNTTAAYSPRTNGQAESCGKTLMLALRKTAEENRTEWPSHLPYLSLAYNTKVNATTKYRPDEIRFGKKLNDFIDYSKEEENFDLDQSLKKRADELRELINGTQQRALMNIHDRQLEQNRVQNKQHNIVVDRLPIGTRLRNSLRKKDSSVNSTRDTLARTMRILVGRISKLK